MHSASFSFESGVHEAGLTTHGAAAGEAGRDLPRGEHEGQVPRRDEARDAGRALDRVVQVIGAVVGRAVHVVRHLGEEVEVVRRAGNLRAARLGDRQAGIHRLDPRDLRGALA